MFNSPILDVTIGLVFIFLLYSLLATSVNEAVAVTFSLRARMLKTAIIERMLSNIPDDSRWVSFWKGVKAFIIESAGIFTGRPKKKEHEKKIGDKFYEHAIIKNYSASRIFSTPSYIPSKNFALVLKDALKQEFENRKKEIALYAYNHNSSGMTIEQIEQQIDHYNDFQKIKDIIEYYGRHYRAGRQEILNPVIDKETWEILQLHLKNSFYDFEQFSYKLEEWFNDTMDRVGGWYKRQVQTILFFMGLIIAIVFNVDSVQITERLSRDDEAREKLVQAAIVAADKYKDDPRVKKIRTATGEIVPDTTASAKIINDSIFRMYQTQLENVIKTRDKELSEANMLISAGWGDYGMKKDSAKVLSKMLAKKDTYKLGDITLTKNSSPQERQQALEYLYKHHWFKYKVTYVIKQPFKGIKLLGFLITAFAICLGAPFWFDLLNKLVKLRGTGKKEGNGGTGDPKSSSTPPITLNVQTQTREEAVG